MGYDRIVYIRYHFSCGLDRKDACWLSFTPLTGIVYTTFEIQDYSFCMHHYERIVVCLTTFSASNCQAHHTGFAKVGQLRMNLKRCRRGALPFSSATNDDLWHCGKYVEMANINVCMICSRHLLFSFLRIFWCSHRPKESASPFNHIFPFAASLI